MSISSKKRKSLPLTEYASKISAYYQSKAPTSVPDETNSFSFLEIFTPRFIIGSPLRNSFGETSSPNSPSPFCQSLSSSEFSGVSSSYSDDEVFHAVPGSGCNIQRTQLKSCPNPSRLPSSTFSSSEQFEKAVSLNEANEWDSAMPERTKSLENLRSYKDKFYFVSQVEQYLKVYLLEVKELLILLISLLKQIQDIL